VKELAALAEWIHRLDEIRSVVEEWRELAKLPYTNAKALRETEIAIGYQLLIGCNLVEVLP